MVNVFNIVAKVIATIMSLIMLFVIIGELIYPVNMKVPSLQDGVLLTIMFISFFTMLFMWWKRKERLFAWISTIMFFVWIVPLIIGSALISFNFFIKSISLLTWALPSMTVLFISYHNEKCTKNLTTK